MYRICSWDVGIKNLAYCIILKNGKDFNIEKWGIINLIEDKINKCSMQIKNKEICNKVAKYSAINIDNEIQYYCGKHKNLYIDISDTHTKSVEKIDKNNKTICAYLNQRTEKQCVTKACSKIHDMYLCKKHTNQELNNIIKKSQLKAIKKEKCSFTDSKELATIMYNKLNDIPELLNVNEILIENQPSLKNPVMKTVSCLLFGYFIMKCITDKKDSKVNVRFMCPSNKLKVTDEGSMEIIKQSADNKKYKLTKDLSVKYTKILLKDNNVWLDYLNKYKKQDDMCDCFLQGYYYLFKKL